MAKQLTPEEARAEEEMKAKVADGFVVESLADMTPGYRKALIVQLTVQADTELMSAPSYWMAARYAPSANTQVSAHAIIQDELAHANIAYRLLEDLGESKERLVYGREPHEFKHPYGFDQPLDNWAELVVANGFFEREIASRVEQYGRVVHVFSTYESRHAPEDPEPFMRGINSFQLWNDGTRWWVVSILWEGERAANPIPARYLPGAP